MNALDVLLEALHADVSDETAWLALADALEEDGQPQRAELMRLLRRRCEQTEPRVQELLASGMLPCLPERTNSLGMRFVLLAPGTFLMGSPDDEEGHEDYEGPVHEVLISRPFYLGVYPVTQEQYERVMGTNPSHFQSVPGEDTRRFPVENVSWEDAAEFCRKLSELPLEKKSGRVYHLPSEAEWEYSCRGEAPTSQVFHVGDSLSSKQANFDGNYPYGGAEKGDYLARTCKVGNYKPNQFGLFDMHGNVWEWCSDWYAADYYGKSPPQDPPGPSEGSLRVSRGGGWSSLGQGCRSADRSGLAPAYRYDYLGFRVAWVPSEER
jgi:uncharacterized protein (TIGR02996 family)